MHLFFTDVQKVRKVGEIPGLDAVELSGLLARWAPAVGTPIALSESMTPVEPLCSWFRELGLDRGSVKTMRATAYQFDGAGLPVLLDGRGQAVARLIPGATPTPEPDKADSVLEPPTVTDEARQALAPAVALPATLVPADQRQLIGRWAPKRGHKAAYLEFTADGEWHGSDGCNDQSGRWVTAAGGTLLNTARAVTLAYCVDSVPIAQWVTTARRAGFDGKVLLFLNAHGDEIGRLSPTN
ncbi:META domain-containing protein [Micromonospora sp. NPDC047187]|uniref:META domain-containing protein n=1 Tax=Micromonospora sp. NPDC047187 TaxID=3155262 RepID=UPI0033F9CFEB